MKNAKSFLMVTALAMGMGLGFAVAFTPAEAQAAECVRDYHCDSMKVCGEPNAAVCSFGRCVCTR